MSTPSSTRAAGAESPLFGPLVIAPASAPAYDRVVPLTRLPLRHQSDRIAWPERLDEPHAGTRAGRHATLLRFAREPDVERTETLIAAYREEDAEGRILALRALARLPSSESARAAFREALRLGADDERALAVDAIAERGERDDLIAAFDDRVDAIAAKAALAYVASNARAAYYLALAPHIEPQRIETILALLAGAVE